MSTAPRQENPPQPELDSESLTALQVNDRVALDVPYGLTVAAAWSWRLILVFIAVSTAIWLLSHVSILVIPLLVAALLATLLAPVHRRMRQVRIPNGLAVLLCILGLIGVVLGLFYLAGQQLAVGFADMRDQIVVGFEGIIGWLASMGVTTDQWNDVISDLAGTVRNNSQAILSGALGFGSTAGNIAAGTVLAIFSLIFFLLDGNRIWTFLLKFVPQRHRRAIDGAGRAGWTSLGSYVRVQIFVAFVDAVGIGVGAWLLGVPLAFPLAVLVFLGSFIPLVGAVLTGGIAVLLALVANDWVNALLMLGVVLLVQQIEGNILQPLVMGRAVSLHPLAVFLAVAGGTAVLGLVGAIFAVPVLAFINATVKYLQSKPWEAGRPDPVIQPPPEPTLAERAAELDGPWGKAYETIDGAVRRVAVRSGSTATRPRRRLLPGRRSRNTAVTESGAGENTQAQPSGTEPDQDGGDR